jgi:hypothetical protein
MKLWIVSAGWNHEGAIVLAVCTSQELAEKAEAAVKAEDRYDYVEVFEADTDVFSITRWAGGKRWINQFGDDTPDQLIPIVEYQKDGAV